MKENGSQQEMSLHSPAGCAWSSVPQTAQSDLALAVYAETALATMRYCLIVQDAATRMFSVGESRQ